MTGKHSITTTYVAILKTGFYIESMNSCMHYTIHSDFRSASLRHAHYLQYSYPPLLGREEASMRTTRPLLTV